MQITSLSDAQNNLSRLIKKIRETQQPLVLGEEGKPLAILSAFEETAVKPRTLGGSWEGRVRISEDFDASNEAIAEDFYSSNIFPDD